MTRRAAELAEERPRIAGASPPPVAYAVLVLDSAGRKESQLAADQDNAIVYANQKADRWTPTSKNSPPRCATSSTPGIPYCTGGVMAKNSAWRKSSSASIATIDAWVRRCQGPRQLSELPVGASRAPPEKLRPRPENRS